MIFLDELEEKKLYKRTLNFPIGDNKLTGNVVFLLAPNHQASLNILNHQLLSKKYYKSYYIEKNALYYINQEGCISDEDVIMEDTKVGKIYQDYLSDIDYIRVMSEGKDVVFGFPNDSEEFVLENKSYNNKIRKLIYKDRFKTPKEVLSIYDAIKKTVPFIKYVYLDYDKYNSKNLIIDLSFYIESFFKDIILDDKFKQANFFIDFLNRLVNDKRLDGLYSHKSIIYPVGAWEDNELKNPLSLLLLSLKRNNQPLLQFDGNNTDFLVLGDTGYYKLYLSSIERKDLNRINSLSKKLIDKEPIQDSNDDSKKAIVASITDDIEKNTNIKIHSLTGDTDNIDKDNLIKAINKSAQSSKNKEEALDTMDASRDSDDIKNIIAKLSVEDDTVKMTAARKARLDNAEKIVMGKKIGGTTIKNMIEESHVSKPLPEIALNIDSVNDEWNHMTYMNMNKVYDPKNDITRTLNSFRNLSNPVQLIDLNIEDASTSEDALILYTAKMEDSVGQRFTIPFYVPKIIDDKNMKLGGNEKTISNQLMLIPISKTDDDTVQIVSNYNKIFIVRYNTSKGKSYETADRLMKALSKYNGNKIKMSYTDNTRICRKYELPIDYVDLSSEYDKIETKNIIIFFNQDILRSKYKDKIKERDGLPVGYDKINGKVLYYNPVNSTQAFSDYLKSVLVLDEPELETLYNATNPSTKYTYSKASILNNKIPLIVVLGYSEGLIPVLDKADIKYDITESKKNMKYDSYIKFLDGYLSYNNTYSSSLLLNGLKECDTSAYSLSEVNSRAMWLDFLDGFGGRILGDGLDNFYDLMIDPITMDVLERYHMPKSYTGLLIEANTLLSDNKYIRHTDMSSNRYRSNELIAAYTYKCLSTAYGQYSNALKRGKKTHMSMKKTAVCDAILSDPTSSDTSNLNEIGIAEGLNAVSFKGLAGMNSDRSYGLDKRSFDKSMVNILGMSTGFAGNVGLTRQSTIDSNIESSRGYLKMANEPKDMSVTKTFTITEAMTPFGSTRDDPFRTAMTFIQTSKHGMRVKKSMPCLISTGADQALPYITTNTFSVVSKDDCEVVEKTDTYMIVKYKSGKYDFVNLDNKIEKNSNGGFYISVKLDSKYKVGDKIKKNTVMAYDPLSYSNIVGNSGDVAYNLGVLTKVAIMNTDEAYEDSTIISEYLSDAMTSDIVNEKVVTLKKNSNVYSIVKKGDHIKEGDPLIIFQNAFDDNDVNLLLKNLSADEKEITDLGRKPIRSDVEGVVEDIKIYRTVEKDELSDSLRKIVNAYEKPITQTKNVMKKYGIDSYKSELGADYKLDNTGKLKNVEDGIMISFMLKYEDKMAIGDKLVNYSANKGVVKDIFPAGKEPFSEFRPDEKIHSFLGVSSINGRMVTSTIIMGIINKGLVELDRHVKEICGIPWVTIDEMDF